MDENERVMMNVRSPECESSGVVLQSHCTGIFLPSKETLADEASSLILFYQQTSGEKSRWGTFGSIFKNFKSIEYVLF